MDEKLQLRVQRYGWDAASAYYHDAWQAQLRPAQEILLAMAAVQPSDKILELAAGSGLITFDLAQAVGKAGSILATDLSSKMVAQLDKRAAQLGFTNTKCARMDAQKIDSPDMQFDHVICALGLMYVPNPLLALQEMFRTLKPSGRMTVLVWGERRNCGWADIFPIVDAQVASEVCPMFFATGNGEVLARMAAQVGFRDSITQRTNQTLGFGSADDVCTAVIDGGPVALAVKRFSDETRQQVNHEFLQSIADFEQPDGSFTIPGEFLTLSAARPA